MLYLVKLDAAYKIGYTKNLKSRISSFKTSCVTVELLSWREGSIENEKELHRVLKEYNIKNELYEMNDGLKELFDTFKFDLNLDSKMELDRLKKENDKLKSDLNYYKKIVEGGNPENLDPIRKYCKEFIKMGCPINIDIIEYKDYIKIGDILYKFSDNSFYDLHNNLAKVYTIKNIEMHYIYSGLAVPITELIEITTQHNV